MGETKNESHPSPDVSHELTSDEEDLTPDDMAQLLSKMIGMNKAEMRNCLSPRLKLPIRRRRIL